MRVVVMPRVCRNARLGAVFLRITAPAVNTPARSHEEEESSMAARLKAMAPLTISIGVLAYVATWLALNFTFHWVTVQDGVFGKYGLPHSTHLVLPAIFVGWGLFFITGATRAAFGKTTVAGL